MKAMILAAGIGSRLGEITRSKPKCLVEVRGKTLLEHVFDRLKAIGVSYVVINVHHFSDQVRAFIESRRNFGIEVHFSQEPELLETGGGIYKALPLLGDKPFLVISSDIITAYPLAKLTHNSTTYKDHHALAHVIMVNNPSYHTTGDFYYYDGKLTTTPGKTLTYGNIGVYQPELFKLIPALPQVFPLRLLLDAAIAQNRVTAEHYTGLWDNLGTLEQLAKWAVL